MGAPAAQLYSLLEGVGYGHLDFGSIYKFLALARPGSK
jgi:hypothetical protein